VSGFHNKALGVDVLPEDDPDGERVSHLTSSLSVAIRGREALIVCVCVCVCVCVYTCAGLGKDIIYETIKEYPHCTIITGAPLTNVANAIRS